jgi:REP element-mobilizing transposase RayT
MDRLLDEARQGPSCLKLNSIADTVEAAMRGNKNYELHAWVIMPNHVHLLVTATIQRANWLGPPKGFTAYGCNKILGRTGTPFWRDESYDHEVRNTREFNSIQRCIENNPVKAGLAESPQDYRYSSASQTRPRL